MGWPQIISGAVLVAALVLVALFYAWRQVLLLRSLRDPAQAPFAEVGYERAKAWRRLINSGLMLVLAALLGGALLYLEEPAEQQGKASDARKEDPEHAPPLSEKDRTFARVYGWYWVATLTVLLVVVLVAAFDLWATQRYGRRQRQKMREDQQAMIQRQVQRLREPEEE